MAYIGSKLPSAVQNNITAVNSAANTLGVGGFTKTFVGAAQSISDMPGIQSYTPVLAFGGASVGITYTLQNGFYNVTTYADNSKRVDLNVVIVLSNKGSSTGSATISLPVTTGANGGRYIMPVTAAGIASTSGGIIFIQPDGSALTARLDYSTGNGGSYTQLSNTSFGNTSAFNFQGFYYIN